MFSYTSKKCGENPVVSNYLDQIILSNIAPTVTGVKAASLINFTTNHHHYCLWRQYSLQQFKNLLYGLNLNQNISFYTLHQEVDHHSLILFYDPEILATLLKQPENQQFLTTLGYNPDLDIDGYLQLLAKKFNVSCPHEVGIFLGFPVADVIGFIKNKGQNYLLNKYWKVYDNLSRAKKFFSLYDQARVEVIQKFNPSPSQF